MESQIVLNGFYYSLSLMTLVVGLALMFGIMRIVMLAYGELFVLAMYIIWYLRLEGWNYGAASIVALAAVIPLGLILERYLFRRYRGYLLPCLVVSIGLILILQTGILLGVDAMGYGLGEKVVTPIMRGTTRVFGAVISHERLLLAGIGLVVLVAGIVFMRMTKLGKTMRAVVQDPEAAAALGVNLDRVTLVTMVIACSLAGLYGIFRAPMVPFGHDSGFTIMLPAFVAVILGGAGSMGGAVLATFVIGFTLSIVGSLHGTSESIIAIYVLVILVLLIRPQGLFGYHLHVR